MSEGDFNWDSLNKMLRDGQVMCDVASNSNGSQRIALTYTGNSNCLRNGAKFIFENSEAIAQLEHQHNDEQPIECTLKHIEVAKIYCCDEFGDSVTADCGLDAFCSRPLSLLVLQCFYTKQNDSVTIYTDMKRLPLIRYAFGENYEEKENVTHLPEREKLKRKCTQIVFESGDLESAVDALFANLSDRTITPWRLNSIYVQETLRNQFYSSINDRLKALNNLKSSTIVRSKFNGTELTQKFGGKYIESDDKSIALLIETLPKYIETFNGDESPVGVNFFRTAKEVIQLVNDDDSRNITLDQKFASIWTENISLLYELVNSLNVRYVWSNCVGLYHQSLRQNGFSNKGIDERYEVNFHC